MSLLFEHLDRAATADPSAVALEVGGVSLTYDQYRARALAFAGALETRGIGRGDRVSIWLPKVEETYVGVFGTLAANAAYVPVDITAPADRAAWITDNAQCQALICRGAELARLPQPWPAELRLVAVVGRFPEDFEVLPSGPEVVAFEELVEESSSFEPRAGEPEDLAYILYTSGSTGRPKGVAISQRAANAFVTWAADLCGLEPTDRLSNHATLSFDLSTFDIFATAVAGATLVPVPNWPSGRGYPFARFIQDKKISVWYSVPTILSRIAENQARKPLSLGSLRTVIFAGEVFPKASLIELSRFLPGVRLFNWYGPTETNVCLSHEVEAADLESPSPLPIGQACAFAELAVRDEVDGVGELLVAGGSVMSGYWREARLDDEVFVELDGRRFYPTGDHVSRDAAGRVLFHGRRDTQIKIHGHRIELGEIEEVLAAADGVVEAAAASDGESLWAFVALDGASAETGESALRDECGRRLPPYMVPQRILTVESLPRTERGKVDRQALLGELADLTVEAPAGAAEGR